MPIRELPARPNLEHLKNQAHSLLRDALASDVTAATRFSEYNIPAPPKLADALHVIAREHGFETWPRLKLHVELASAEPMGSLVAAIKANDATLVRQLLASDPQSVHARGGDGQLPLHSAASIEIATMLLDAGAEIDARDIEHESIAAQYMAAQRPHRHDVARYLIARGAQTDILMAAALGDRASVERILNDDPETIRMTATERFFPKRDAQSGGSIYFSGFGWTRPPHLLAHQFGHAEVLSLLMQRSPLWLRLLVAAETGQEEQFQRILADHPQLFRKLSSNARRLIGVAVRNNTRAPKLLLAAGWPADPVMDTGHTPLHFAAWHGNLEVVGELLARKAPVNVFETQHGGNSLAWALHGSQHSWYRDQGDYPAVARALLAAGAQIPQPGKPLEATEEVLAVINQPINTSSP